MQVLVTGAAGFIGFHVAEYFLSQGHAVVGIDNLNSYYSPQLKQSRLLRLQQHERFVFRKADISKPEQLVLEDTGLEETDLIAHLAAQAGVRYSVENPYAYVNANVTGQVAVLELAARLAKRPPVVYASSSSVYGANAKIPFAESDAADHPVSVYAATKRAGELIACAYRETHSIHSTGLRFFTVYGRYGRPDMSPWLFTDAILQGRPISVFNNGRMERDFTHISDIVDGVAAAAHRILNDPDHTAECYNLGNSRPVKLMDFIAMIERATGHKAELIMKAKPPGDVVATAADLSRSRNDLAFSPKVDLATGIEDFVSWFRGFNGFDDSEPASKARQNPEQASCLSAVPDKPA